MTLERRQRILNALSQEKRMSAEQLAKIAYPDGDKPLVIYSKNTHHYPPGYQMTLRLLADMAAPKDRYGIRKKPQIKRHPSPYKEYPDLYMLPETRKLQFGLYQHELICADVYGAYHQILEEWDEPRDDVFVSLKLEPDRHMKLFGEDIYLEIDRGTEKPPTIRDKIEKYRQYGQITGKWFYVVFVIWDYKKDLELKLIKDPALREEEQKRKQNKRAMEIDTVAAEARRGHRVLCTAQQWIVKMPLETILVSPMQEKFSFQDLPNLYK